MIGTRTNETMNRITIEEFRDKLDAAALAALDERTRELTGEATADGWKDQELPALLPAIRRHAETVHKRIYGTGDATNGKFLATFLGEDIFEKTVEISAPDKDEAETIAANLVTGVQTMTIEKVRFAGVTGIGRTTEPTGVIAQRIPVRKIYPSGMTIKPTEEKQ